MKTLCISPIILFPSQHTATGPSRVIPTIAACILARPIVPTGSFWYGLLGYARASRRTLWSIGIVVLLVDGHSTHIDLEVSKFCRDQQIHLYCLPPHTSHILQPLDVGFFGALKRSWGKACDTYRLENPGVPLSKYTFASVFKHAWIDSVKMSTFVNAFRESGICPLNPQAISHIKLSPSLAYSSESSVTLPKVDHFKCNGSLHEQIEKMMKPETMELYQKRLEEGYDLENDELYVIWSQLKKMSISDQSAKECLTHSKRVT